MNSTTVRKAGGHVQPVQESRRIKFIASHEKPDRDGQVIAVAGLDTKAFMRNPILLVQHDWKSRAVGKVESLHVAMVDGAPALLGTAFFPDRPASTEAYADVVAGLFNAVSVGLTVYEQGPPRMPGQTGTTIVRSELLEISMVSIPACSTCLISQKEFNMKSACHCTELDLTPEQVAQLPSLIRESVDAEFKKLLAPRRDEIDLSDPQVRRIVADLPAIVTAAFHEAIRHEVALGLRRAAGRLD